MAACISSAQTPPFTPHPVAMTSPQRGRDFSETAHRDVACEDEEEDGEGGSGN